MDWLVLIFIFSVGCLVLAIKAKKSWIKMSAGAFGAIMMLLSLFLMIVYFNIHWAVKEVDKRSSSDGQYNIYLKSVGETVFFGPAEGKLVLKHGDQKISEYKFMLFDDGGQVRPDCWNVTWDNDKVIVIIFGEEMNDLKVVLYFNGEKESKTLDTKYGEKMK